MATRNDLELSVNPYLVTAGLSYLSGSIPFGYLLMRIFRGQDVRKTGSGNIGATNVSRTSPRLGFLTLLLDALKGLIPVLLVTRFFPVPERYALAGVAALFAILGHLFPVWLGFRGGKGVATGLGSWLAIAPQSVLVMVVVFVLMVAAFRYISLGSIVAAAVFPIAAWVLRDYHQSPVVLACMATASLVIIWKHRPNIQRLLTGRERRFRQKTP
jgi:glycerol-3-phosphate acyltransferase PlsY